MKTKSFFFRNFIDAHVHLRQDGDLVDYAPDTAEYNSAGLIMPNTEPPIRTSKEALIYREEIIHSLPAKLRRKFLPLMTVYITSETDPKDVALGFKKGVFVSAKLYPPHATTGSGYAPKNLEDIFPLLEIMEEIGMPLCIHGEMELDIENVDVFKSEKMFLKKKLPLILKNFPKLKTTMEHITTRQMAEFIANTEHEMRGTITPQHLLLHRNHMLAKGNRVSLYCKPILKAKKHRDYIQQLIVAKHPRFGLGSDSAPHYDEKKYSFDSCAGVFSAPVMHSLYFNFFYENKITDHYQAFASDIMAKFYGIKVPRRTFKISYVPGGWKIPTNYHKVTPLGAGELAFWKVEEVKR